jgi:hypothetical protein
VTRPKYHLNLPPSKEEENVDCPAPDTGDEQGDGRQEELCIHGATSLFVYMRDEEDDQDAGGQFAAWADWTCDTSGGISFGMDAKANMTAT